MYLVFSFAVLQIFKIFLDILFTEHSNPLNLNSYLVALLVENVVTFVGMRHTPGGSMLKYATFRSKTAKQVRT